MKLILNIVNILVYINAISIPKIVSLYRFFNDDQDEVYQNDETFNDIYFKPYCRIPPYVMGIVLGYVLYQHFSKDFKLSWVRYVIQE